MNHLGFKYSENKRSYYTDGHEREDVVRDRNDRFIVDYFEAELQWYHWVQIKLEIATSLEQELGNFRTNCSYEHEENGVKFREYHVDTHVCLLQYISDTNTQYGEKLSVRRDKSKRSMMVMGQDE